MDDLIAEFLTETNESLGELDVDLVNLEQNPNDQDLLAKIFRLMHTIKGTCGFLGLPRLETVAHHAENVLGLFRDGKLEVTPAYVTLIFESIDTVRVILAGIEETGTEPEGDDTALLKKLDDVFNKANGDDSAADELEAAFQDAPGPEEEEKAPESTEPEATDEDGKKKTKFEEAESALAAVEDHFADSELPDEIRLIDTEAMAEEFLNEAESEEQEEPAAPPEEPAAAKPAKSTPPKQPAAAAPPAAPRGASAEDGPKTSAVAAQSLRVNVDVLENLMTMVSELVLTRNQLLQILRTQSESEFTAPLQRLNHVVSELQEGVMKTRMQPIGNAWAKLPRIIRDISVELGKKIDLDMRGQDTELDRQVLDLIKDPLTHMVRNSADHGIETPEGRVAAGKPETGKVILNAYHEGGHIIIEITDDGRGLPLEKIKTKIIERELATAEELEAMAPQQIYQYIFKAGFSTAEKVTAVSGRGVGMDVVRSNIEKIGGSVEMKSVEGRGSSFIIKIPLTLAIVSALIVESGGERFAIPQLAVRELVMASQNGDNRIETIKGTPVFRLRDALLPLVSLKKLLRLEHRQSGKPGSAAPPMGKDELLDATVQEIAQESGQKNQYIVVTQVGAYNFGIIVDRVFDTEEIVVKPVAKILKNIDLFSGNTILGDGSVIMILDPNGIAKVTGEIEAQDTLSRESQSEAAIFSRDERTALLLFKAGDQAPKAVPLSLVSRLENIRMDTVEVSNGQTLVQYRDRLMPLLPFNHGVEMNGHDDKPILVFADQVRSMGLVVDEIIDITEEIIDVQLSGHSGGILGSAIIDGKATDVIDVGFYLKQIDENYFKDHDDTPFQSETSGASSKNTVKKRILLVDDSPFFRNMLGPLLSAAGYDVTPLENPLEALKLCEAGARFDLIVSDIEMPEMDGFAFAEKIKTETSWRDIPMVALSSHATPQDMDRGRTVGFHRYIAKFDRDTLLEGIAQTITEYYTAKQAEKAAAGDNANEGELI